MLHLPIVDQAQYLFTQVIPFPRLLNDHRVILDTDLQFFKWTLDQSLMATPSQTAIDLCTPINDTLSCPPTYLKFVPFITNCIWQIFQRHCNVTLCQFTIPDDTDVWVHSFPPKLVLHVPQIQFDILSCPNNQYHLISSRFSFGQECTWSTLLPWVVMLLSKPFTSVLMQQLTLTCPRHHIILLSISSHQLLPLSTGQSCSLPCIMML